MNIGQTRVALRRLVRGNSYGLVNVVGLAIGLAACGLALLYARHEFRVDQFHGKVDRIYRVLQETRGAEGRAFQQSGTSGPLAPALAREIGEVETVVRASGYGDQLWARCEKRRQRHEAFRVWMVDPEFLSVFDFPVIQGDPLTALSDPYSLVLTEQVAERYFGAQDPLGKTVEIETAWAAGTYVVKAVVRIPPASSFRFDILYSSRTPIPGSWLRAQWEEWQTENRLRPVQTFLLARVGVEAASLEGEIQDLYVRHVGPEAGRQNTYRLQSLSSLHLDTRQEFDLLFSGSDTDFLGTEYGDGPKVYALLSIGIIILLIACANYTSLETARVARRMREVGIRKASGATKIQLVSQFLTESILLSALAAILGVATLSAVLPRFNELVNLELELQPSLENLSLAVMLVLLVGFLSGAYPAFAFAGTQAHRVLRGESSLGSRNRLWKVLVLFQFVSSSVILTLSVIVYEQHTFMMSLDTGFEQHHVVQMPLFRQDRSRKPMAKGVHLSNRFDVVRQAILVEPGVEQVTAYRSEIGTEGGVARQIKLEDGQLYQAVVQEADRDFLETFRIKLLGGRSFTRYEHEGERQFIVNQRVVSDLGLKEPIGYPFWGGSIVGIMANYQPRSFHYSIEPLILHNRTRTLNFLAVRIAKEDVPRTLGFLERIWLSFVPDRPFEFEFIDDRLARAYRSERNLGHLTGVFAVLAVFISAMGMFGLVAFTVEQRRKAIGVRKVVGASVESIVLLLSRDFIHLVAVGTVLALPLAHLLGDRWLQDFAHRVNLGPVTYISSLGVTVLVVLATVVYKAQRGASADPIDLLKSE